MKRTNLQIVQDRRKSLKEELNSNAHLLETLDPKERDRFRSNILEFATQDYLLSVIEPKEIIRFAVSVTKTGLDIAPSAKEVYIVPFDTKVQDPNKPGQKIKVMLPQAIVPLNGAQQLAYDQSFFLKQYAVYKFDDGTYGSEMDLTRDKQAQLRTADSDWVDKHFIGFDVSLKDLKGELPDQLKFIELSYLQEATKTIKDNRWKLQTYRHKAVRRAMGDFMIPRSRKVEALEKLEHINDAELESVGQTVDDNGTASTQVLDGEKENALKQLGLEIVKKDGIAHVSGNTFQHAATLKDLGFELKNKAWIIKDGTDKNGEQKPKLEAPVKEPVQDPAKALFKILKENGLDNESAKEYAKSRGLSSTNPGGIEPLLQNEEELVADIEAFKADSDMQEANALF